MPATRRAALLAPFLAITAILGVLYEQLGQRGDRRQVAQVGRSVDIGGRTMNIFCSGEGSPAVVLDSGAGSPGHAWSHIQPQLAAFARACWFDRTGYGWSEPGPFPRTSAAMSDDLHALLHAAGIPPPYVLVGHSLGGLNARVYTGMFPADVAGAVLVDAAHEDEPRRAPAFMRGHSAPRFLWREIWWAGKFARAFGILRLFRGRVALPADAESRTRQQLVRWLQARPNAVAALFDASAPESYAQAERSAGFGDRPLIVLTRGRTAVLPANPSEEDRQFAAYEQIWMHEIQPKLARLSTRGRQIIVPGSGHAIPEEAPAAIIDAVRDVVFSVRQR